MAGFRNLGELGTSLTDDGRTWISTFRKFPASGSTFSGNWVDLTYAGGNPIANYYAAAPLESSTLDPAKGIIVPRMVAGEKQFVHRVTAMAVAASATTVTADSWPLFLMDYLLFYPFVDMDAAGEDQAMLNSVTLPRYEDGVGVQMMVVAQSNTVGGGRFTITFIDSDDVERTTISMYCYTAQPPGTVVNTNNSNTGLVPFVPLPAGCRGVKSVVSVNFSVGNGGLCAVVLVRPLDTHYTMEASRRTTTGTLESFGGATEREAMRHRAGMVEIKDGAFLGFLGQGTTGSINTSLLVGTLETVWR